MESDYSDSFSNSHIIDFSCLQICMLDLVLKVLPEDSKESQTARILLYKLFYDQTDQGLTQFLLNLLKSFDTHKQAKRYFSCPFNVPPIFIYLFCYASSKDFKRKKKRKKPVSGNFRGKTFVLQSQR